MRVQSLFVRKHQFFPHLSSVYLRIKRNGMKEGNKKKRNSPESKIGKRSTTNIGLCQEENLFNFIAFSISLPGPPNPILETQKALTQKEEKKNRRDKLTRNLILLPWKHPKPHLIAIGRGWSDFGKWIVNEEASPPATRGRSCPSWRVCRARTRSRSRKRSINTWVLRECLFSISRSPVGETLNLLNQSFTWRNWDASSSHYLVSGWSVLYDNDMNRIIRSRLWELSPPD